MKLELNTHFNSYLCHIRAIYSVSPHFSDILDGMWRVYFFVVNFLEVREIDPIL